MSQRKAGISTETFDEFLRDDGILEACEERALNEVIADKIKMDASREVGLTPAGLPPTGPTLKFPRV